MQRTFEIKGNDADRRNEAYFNDLLKAYGVDNKAKVLSYQAMTNGARPSGRAIVTFGGEIDPSLFATILSRAGYTIVKAKTRHEDLEDVLAGGQR